MKRSSLLFLMIILGLLAWFAHDGRWGRSLFSDLFSGELADLEKRSLAFMEDIRFKDFEKAASYHHPEDREKADIPKLIERLFKIKPELLDLMDYQVLSSSLDSSKSRARVKLKAKVNLLNSDKIREPEFILYYHKNKGGNWYMELASSLHGP